MRNSSKLAVGGVGLTAIAASVALTGGTSAFFYDLEKSTGNSIEACDFDLTYRMSNPTALASAGQASATTENGGQVLNGGDGAITLANLQPGDSYKVDVNLRNAGSCAGELYMDVDQHVDSENGRLEPETSAGDTDDTGDMGETLRVKVFQDEYLTVHDGSLADFAAAVPRRIDADFTGRDEHKVSLTFTVPDSGERGTENVIMTDSYSFDLDFAVTQKGKLVPGSTGDLG